MAIKKLLRAISQGSSIPSIIQIYNTEDDKAIAVDTNFPLPTVAFEAALEIAKGNVPGQSIVQIAATNQRVGITFEDIWDAGGKLVYPTIAETWEILSSSANDTLLGTGMRTVLIKYLDTKYVEQSEIKILNGLTPVTFTATDAFRFVSAQGLTWGATTQNEGNITIRNSNGNAIRGQINIDDIVPEDITGFNNSQDSHFTIPAGKAAFPVFVSVNVNKDHDVTVRARMRLFGLTGFYTAGQIRTYQTNFIEDLSVGPAGLPEKTDIFFEARSNNTTVEVDVQIIAILIDMENSINILGEASQFFLP